MNLKNDFLITLLGVQQDGKDAISLPNSWKRDIPLKIETKRSNALMGFAEEIFDGDKENGRWHFLLGSPGNGKSALIGMLFKKLVDERHCVYTDPPDTPSEAVPYRREIRSLNEKFNRLWLIQDASTVRQPYESEVDEASELARELKEAEKEGVSIIVCANRGILERVYDKHRCSEQWYQAIKYVVDKKNDGVIDLAPKKSRPPFKKALVTFDAMDKESILIESNDFENLLDKALKDDSWIACENCDCKLLCPFYNNRNSLLLEDWKNSFKTILSSIEIWSGQPVVFREALSIISYVLAGCPSDYSGQHPCDWVFDQVTKKNIFVLLSRRVYFQIFASQEPAGLDKDPVIMKEQWDVIKNLENKIPEDNEHYLPINSLINNPLPRTDVGAERVLGLGGIFQLLDPTIENHDTEFFNKWALNNTDELSSFPGLCQLETQAFQAWNYYQNVIGEQIADENQQMLAVINRWASSFIYRLGGFITEEICWHKEIGIFYEVIKRIKTSPDEDETLFSLEDLGNTITKIMAQISHSDNNEIKITPSISIGGEGVKNSIKTKVLAETSGAGLTMSATFGASNAGVISVQGEQLAWFLKTSSESLYPSCIPKELLFGYLHTLGRVASAASDYSRMKEDVYIKITDALDQTKVLNRVKNAVRITDKAPNE